jgi:hypothetical protein
MTTLTQTAQVSRRRELLTVLTVSLSVTAVTSVVSGVLYVVAGVDVLLAMSYLRWSVVAVLLASPLAWQLVGARAGLTLPYAMRTPVTALLLTCESIVVDIISANF